MIHLYMKMRVSVVKCFHHFSFVFNCRGFKLHLFKFALMLGYFRAKERLFPFLYELYKFHNSIYFLFLDVDDSMASAPPLTVATAPPVAIPHALPTIDLEILVAKVELRISCQNLRDRDILSKSDPVVVLYTERRTNDGIVWKEFDRTEVVKDNLNPSFVKSFIVNYHFEMHQKLKFEVYDIDSASKNLQRHDYLGYIIVSLGSIVGEFGGRVMKPLLGKNNKPINSSISFFAEELCDNKEMITFQFKGRKLEKKNFLGQPDPFLVFYRHGIENSDFVAVHKTETIKNNFNPTWKSFNIPVTTFCNGDKHRPVKIGCFDYNSDGSHSLIGDLNITLDEVLKENNFSRELLNPKKRNKKNYKNSGWLDLEKILLKSEPSFLEYIFGGIELCFHVAVDFTASNGNPLQPTSLHFLNRDSPNKYVQALTAIGQICEDYDSDKMMPAYGFGAKIRGHVYHDFHLNQRDDPNCRGIAGVLEAYENFLPTAELYGPTNFSPVINLVTQTAISEKTRKKYHILLILTDGVITDIDQTKNAIIKASLYPISIIIVGIGSADFSAMDELDCDKGTLTYQGKKAEQDIVQFIPYDKFSGSFAAEDLAREVLFEVPRQLVQYMTRNNIKPNTTYQSQILCRTGSMPIQNKHIPEKKLNKSLTSPAFIPPYSNAVPNGSAAKNNHRISAKEHALQTLARYNAL